MIEMEVKAKAPADAERILVSLGAIHKETLKQEDEYFQHPVRDFAKTDEALRLRKENNRTFLTYKGPKAGGPVKTREELEIPVEPSIRGILLKLGFTPVASVKKIRRTYIFQKFAVSIDEVEGLGLFLEAEAQQPAEKEEFFELLKNFGVKQHDAILASYLEMLTDNIVTPPKE